MERLSSWTSAAYTYGMHQVIIQPSIHRSVSPSVPYPKEAHIHPTPSFPEFHIAVGGVKRGAGALPQPPAHPSWRLPFCMCN